MGGVKRFAAASIGLSLVLAAACSQTSAGDPTERRPEPLIDERASESPAPATSDDAEHEEASDPATERRPRFEGGVFRIGPTLRKKLIGRNWTAGCPVPIDDLRVLRVSYWNFRGGVGTGPLVLHERVARDVLWVFQRLFRAKFRIQVIELAAKDRPITRKDYWNKSRRSVTASFNCRPATDSTSLSQHSYGWAIDINPLQNPYVRSDGSTLRRIAQEFKDRSQQRMGMIHEGDIVVRSFAAIGWEWGGHWHTLKDYMHFSLTGR
jgi:D-alanyl-D-alanine carboxypeptidase